MQTYAESMADAERYNRLGPILEVDEEVRRGNALDKFLADAGRLFVNSELQSDFGVVLLHRHVDLDDSEVVVQSLEVQDGTEFLVSRKTVTHTCKDELFPIVYGVEADGSLMSFEYSTAPALRQRLELLKENGSIATSFSDLAAQHGLRGKVGISVYTRDLFSNSNPNFQPVEQTNLAEQASYLQLVDPEVAEDAPTVQTNWFFSAEPGGIGCRVTCAYRCFARSPGHSKEHAGTFHGPVV
jgi:hypothetical protein